MASVETPRPSPAAADVPRQRELLCPRCGYDLRAATSDRCSECGLVLDLASMSESKIPWAHRDRIGRVSAFVSTVWKFAIGSRSLKHEVSREQRPGDARAFARWTSVLLFLGFIAMLTPVLLEEGPAVFETNLRNRYGGTLSTRGRFRDLEVKLPWSAGVTAFGFVLPPVCLLGLAWYHPPPQAAPSNAEGVRRHGRRTVP